MNLCLFFEGTGRGVAGKVTNVTRLRDICVDDVRQKLHLEAGPGTRLGSYLCGKIAGSDWQAIFRDARRWFEANYETLPKDGIATKVFLFGFSRGALIARHFAAWLDKLGTARQAAEIAAVLVDFQNGLVDSAAIYDARCGVGNYSPLFNPLTYKPHKAAAPSWRSTNSARPARPSQRRATTPTCWFLRQGRVGTRS